MDSLNPDIEEIIRRAIQEDVDGGDVTTQSIVPAELRLSGQFIAKTEGVIAGWDIVRRTFKILDSRVHLQPITGDGESVAPGQTIADVNGPAQAILTGERTALNFLQRMSGIATLTRAFVNAIRGTSAVILDTRKTAPGMRVLDKLAVKIGGGTNHRIGLFDMFLIKENHIAATGGITEAIRRISAKNVNRLPVEVEVRSLSELREALGLQVDRILLDNMSIEEMRAAVEETKGRIPLEASGNIDLSNVRKVAETGINYISVGSLTHSVRALDVSFLVGNPL